MLTDAQTEAKFVFVLDSALVVLVFAALPDHQKQRQPVFVFALVSVFVFVFVFVVLQSKQRQRQKQTLSESENQLSVFAKCQAYETHPTQQLTPRTIDTKLS